jgi:hypothetical protein
MEGWRAEVGKGSRREESGGRGNSEGGEKEIREGRRDTDLGQASRFSC